MPRSPSHPANATATAPARPPPPPMGPAPALTRAPIRAGEKILRRDAREAKPTAKGSGEAPPVRRCGRDGCDKPLRWGQVKYCSITCSTARRTETGHCVVCKKPAFSRYALICSMTCRTELIRQRGYRHVHPPEFVAKVEVLWGEGLSTSKIGERLGVSKCVIIGLARRLALPPRENPIKTAKAKPVPTSSRRRPVAAGAACPAPKPRANLGTSERAASGPPPSFRWKSDATRKRAVAPVALPAVRVVDIPGTGCQFPLSMRPWRVCDAPRVPSRAGSTRLGPYCADCSRRCYGKVAA